MEETMVIGRFIEGLLRGWRWIVLAVLACVVGAVVFSLTRPAQYSARALVATVRASTRVTLGSDIVTLSEDDLAKASASAKERMQSLVVFVSNPTIADEVLAELDTRLPEEFRNPKRLLRTVRGSLASGSDTIEIQVTTREPRTSEMIANAWSHVYVRQINELYEGLEASLLGVIDEEVAEAEALYRQRQADLEAWLAQDRRDTLQREILDKTYLLDDLTLVRRTGEYGALTYQQLAYQGTLDKLAGAQQAQLSNLIAGLDDVEALLRDASGMRAQVSAGGDPAARSNEVALVLLKTRAFAQTTTSVDQGEYALQQPISLSIQPGGADITAAAMVADLDALVTTLEARRAALEIELTQLAEAQLRGEDWLRLEVELALGDVVGASPDQGGWSKELDATISSYEQELSAAQTQLAQADRRFLELENQRDLAWQTYDALMRRQAELSISSQTMGARVRVAVPASTPDASASNIVVNVALAAVAGLLVGAAAAWAASFWRTYRQRAAEAPPAAGSV